VAAHAWCWKQLPLDWNDIIVPYRQVRIKLYESLAGFRQAYAEVKQQVERSWEAARNKEK
jgi:hypothetical protein